MLALLKTSRSAAAAAGPAARAARLPPPLLLQPAGQQRTLSGWTAQPLMTLQRRLLAVLRQHSRIMLRLCVVQCEFVLIYRTRRTMQLFELYSSLYEREALREMLRSVRRLLAAHGRRLLLSAALLGGPDPAAPQQERPADQGDGPVPADRPPARHGYEEEFDRFVKLCDESIVCPDCGKRQLIDRKVNKVAYCACADGEPTPAVNRGPDASWVPFIERNHVVVWRQQHPEHAHLYSYKVFGSYGDVSAEAFFEVQLNTAYRSQWDPSVLELHTLDTRPAEHGDVIYWRVRFPSMFQNRDYVFDRRYYVDEAARQMTIVSRCTGHPECPERPGVVRVRHYWSVMVIRPHTEFDQPGLDFGLTYFDDPGTYLPPVITNYVAATGVVPVEFRRQRRSSLCARFAQLSGAGGGGGARRAETAGGRQGDGAAAVPAARAAAGAGRQ
ncbi:stAR-related lipid transfer protein 7, mitochondrial-like isoform X2 [Pollicipes pollicipes]|uniref:stAR-related lipid transfer protein 7, mitochondrial-like isoform X2 n=1 Tax=Pollicipes pollicipes TaxID=41117 RepID=UPI001884ECE1|nr:stAR-related lipid transfer protein 7, mitochondrial-like isoform X2 [Pollicipes pollicipes]